jgi:hypothetical protein
MHPLVAAPGLGLVAADLLEHGVAPSVGAGEGCQDATCRASLPRVRNLGQMLTWTENAAKVKSGVDDVLAKDLQAHKSAWEKVVAWCLC